MNYISYQINEEIYANCGRNEWENGNFNVFFRIFFPLEIYKFLFMVELLSLSIITFYIDLKFSSFSTFPFEVNLFRKCFSSKKKKISFYNSSEVFKKNIFLCFSHERIFLLLNLLTLCVFFFIFENWKNFAFLLILYFAWFNLENVFLWDFITSLFRSFSWM